MGNRNRDTMLGSRHRLVDESRGSSGTPKLPYMGPLDRLHRRFRTAPLWVVDSMSVSSLIAQRGL